MVNQLQISHLSDTLIVKKCHLRLGLNTNGYFFQACATFCLLTEACLSFDFNATLPDCNWFTVADTAAIVERSGYVYYPKNLKMVSNLLGKKNKKNFSGGTFILATSNFN